MLLDCASIPTCFQHMAVLSSSVAPSELRMHQYTPKKFHKSDNTATTGICCHLIQPQGNLKRP